MPPGTHFMNGQISFIDVLSALHSSDLVAQTCGRWGCPAHPSPTQWSVSLGKQRQVSSCGGGAPAPNSSHSLWGLIWAA